MEFGRSSRSIDVDGRRQQIDEKEAMDWMAGRGFGDAQCSYFWSGGIAACLLMPTLAWPVMCFALIPVNTCNYCAACGVDIWCAASLAWRVEGDLLLGQANFGLTLSPLRSSVNLQACMSLIVSALR